MMIKVLFLVPYGYMLFAIILVAIWVGFLFRSSTASAEEDTSNSVPCELTSASNEDLALQNSSDDNSVAIPDCKQDDAATNKDEDIGKQVSAQEKENILRSFLAIESFGRRTNLDEAEKQSLNDAISHIGSLNARQIVMALNSKTGEDLANALHAVGTLSVLCEHADPRSLNISQLGVSILIAAAEVMLPNRNDASVLLAMYNEMLPRQNGSLKPVSEIFGCGTRRISSAQDRIKANGLQLDSIHANAAGAGKPSVAKDFADVYEPMCSSAGLDRQELIDRHVSHLLDEAANAIGGTADTSCTESTDNAPEGFENVSIEKEVPLITDNAELSVAQCYTRVSEITSQTIAALRPLDRDNVYGRIDRIVMIQDIIVRALEDIRIKFPEIIIENGNSDNPLNQDDNSDKRLNQDDNNDKAPFEAARNTFKGSCVRATLKEIEKICNSLNKYAVQDIYSAREAYRTIRTIDAEIKPRQLKSALLQIQCKYECSMKMADVIEKAVSNRPVSTQEENKPLQDDNTAMLAVPDVKIVDQEIDISTVAQKAETVIAELNVLITRFEKVLQIGSAQNEQMSNVLEMLRNMTEMISNAVNTDMSNDNRSAVIALSNIVETVNTNVRKWMYLWDQQKTVLASARQVSNSILSRRFQKTLRERFTEFHGADNSDSSEDETAEPSANESTKHVPEKVSVAEISENARSEANESIHSVKEQFETLVNLLVAGQEKRVVRKNNTENCISESVDYLNDVLKNFLNAAEAALKSNDAEALFAFRPVIAGFSSYVLRYLGKWIIKDNEYIACYTTSKAVSASLLSKKNKKYIEQIWVVYDNDLQHINYWRENNDISPDYISVEEIKTLVNLAGENKNACIPLEKRVDLIRKFWKMGKDPLDIKIWIEYIVESECKNVYGDPSSSHKYTRLTRDELQTAFYYLTGVSYSSKALWKILTKDMGYSGRQCAKLDQFGKKHPLANEQYAYIQKLRDEAGPDVLALSIDTKAQIVLGKLKHDNGILMCSPDGISFQAYHHDFPLLVRHIYQNGTPLLDDSRLNEKAVLHPVAAYCLNDNTGSVALVLGKDTSESMHNLLKAVIAEKKKQMPGIKKVLIIADGGGSNMSNGILWPLELLYLANEVQLPLQVAHTAPGCSKHNPIERALFSYISMHWKGRPFLDIEHVATYISTTTTSPANGTPLRVKCWFDKKRYLTNAEKKAAGETIVTRAMFDKMAENRIVHSFSNDSDMYKWNYTVLPSNMATNSVTLEAA